MTVLRERIGEVLRSRRIQQGRTLREISADAQVSLGYISEVERGQKEASSELLSALCVALAVPMSTVLREVSDRLVLDERADARRAGSLHEIGSVTMPATAIDDSEVVAAA